MVIGDVPEADFPEPAPVSGAVHTEEQADASATGEAPDRTIVLSVPPPPAGEPRHAEPFVAVELTYWSWRTALANQHLRDWSQLSRDEVATFVARSSEGLHRVEADADCAAAGLLGLILGRLPEEAASMAITRNGTSVGLNVDTMTLTLALPRAPHAWRPPSSGTAFRLHSSADTYRVRLPVALARYLRHRLSNAPTGSLIGTALSTGGKSLADRLSAWFAEMRLSVPRVTPRRIARSLRIAAFDRSQRACMAYLVAGYPREPPPTGVYYAGFPLESIEELHLESLRDFGLDIAQESKVSATSDPLMAGSMLLPDQSELRQKVMKLRQRVVDAVAKPDRDSLVPFHNLYTAYTVELLFFATGHRPVSDPFESLRQLDLDLGLALVDDKKVSNVPGCRLIPLIPLAREAMRGYLAYLQALAAKLAPVCPNLSEAIRKISTGSSAAMPLFFTLSEEGALRWDSLSGASLARVLDPDWPYPYNLHRHVMATHLHATQCPETSINAFLGHAETGTATLSHLSPLTASEVIAPLLEPLASFTANLGFEPIAGAAIVPRLPEPIREPRGGQTLRVFGTASRAEARASQRRDDESVIAKIVDDLLQRRAAPDLVQADLDACIEAINTGADGAMTRTALLRRRLLRERLIGRIAGHPHLRLPYEWIVEPEPGLFALDTLANARHHRGLREVFEARLADGLRRRSRRWSVATQWAEAVLSLVMHGRVLDHQLIRRWIAGQAAEVVYHPTIGFAVEFALDENGSSIRRYPVPPITASLVAALSPLPRAKRTATSEDTGSAAQRKVLAALTEVMAALATAADVSQPEGLKSLCELAAAQASLEVSGVELSFLAGLRQEVSLPRGDLVRLLTGKQHRSQRAPTPTASETGPDVPLVPGTLSRRQNDVAGNSSRKVVARFAADVDKDLRELMAKVESKEQPSSKARAELSRRVLRLEQSVAAHPGAPPLCGYLGTWLRHLCDVGGARRKYLAFSSIIAYWTTLRDALVESGHEHPLHQMPSSAVECVYTQVLETAHAARGPDAVGRLQYFHLCLQAAFGAPVIDWRAITDGLLGSESFADGGFVTDGAYLKALELLRDDDTDRRTATQNAMALLLVYRFGLRFGEAFEIRRRDVLTDNGRLRELNIWSDSYRLLKTHGAIRRIPLLGALRPIEQAIIDDWIAHVDLMHGEDRLAFFFAPRTDSRRIFDKARAHSRITQALRAATGDPEIRIHHCRHTFATRLQIALCTHGPDGTRIWAKMGGLDSPQGFVKDANALLPRGAPDRRALWQLGVLLGHAHPDTSLQHYCHGHDLLLAARQVRDPAAAWDHWQWAAALDVEVRSLRKWMIRQEVFPDAAQIALRVKGICSLADEAISPARAPQLPPSRRREATQAVPASQLAWIYAMLEPDTRLESIAQRLSLRPELVADMIGALGSECQEICFDLDAAADKHGSGNASAQLLPHPRTISARELTGLARALDRTEKNASDALRAARTVFRASYKPLRDAIVVCAASDIERVLPVLHAAEAAVTLHLPPDGSTDAAFLAEMRAVAEAHNLDVVTDEFLPTAISGRTRRELSRRGGLFVAEQRTGNIRSHKCAAVFLLLISTLTRLRTSDAKLS
jgi:integrase